MKRIWPPDADMMHMHLSLKARRWCKELYNIKLEEEKISKRKYVK
jgi:hypothetical protein